MDAFQTIATSVELTVLFAISIALFYGIARLVKAINRISTPPRRKREFKITINR